MYGKILLENYSLGKSEFEELNRTFSSFLPIKTLSDSEIKIVG